MLTAAVGVVSGKRFYALSESALRDLPADTSPPSHGADGAPPSYPRQTAERRHVRLCARTWRSIPVAVFGGRYRILAELGAGGMGVVYKAHDLELDDVVALKMLQAQLHWWMANSLNGSRAKSSLRERSRIRTCCARSISAKSMASRIISMEYVRGLTLRYLLSETRRIPYSAGLRIARQLCAGLAAAHEVGVLHRDIKPENLILEQTGNAKLMDFGIARPIRRSGPGHTRAGHASSARRIIRRRSNSQARRSTSAPTSTPAAC